MGGGLCGVRVGLGIGEEGGEEERGNGEVVVVWPAEGGGASATQSHWLS